MEHERLEEYEPCELRPGIRQMIESIRHKTGLNPTACVRELIDNSFDAGAMEVNIHLDRDHARLEISDDGHGTAEIEAIPTPYKHVAHETTESGFCGIGGSDAVIALLNGEGKCHLVSITEHLVSKMTVDYKASKLADRFISVRHKRDNVDSLATGTTITLDGCRSLNPQNIGSIKRELSWTFSPALQAGKRINFTIDGKRQVWEPYKPPARQGPAVKFDFEVEGHRVHGFCFLVKLGETNPVRGWAVVKGHRFLGKFSHPAAGRAGGMARIYSEVTLPKSWRNINDHKDDFVEPPVELWAKLAEACAPIMDRAEKESQSIELAASIQAAQDILDLAVGYGVKGRRPGKPGKPAPPPPKKKGSSHKQFSHVQEGDKPPFDGRGMPRRIVLDWSPELEWPYEVRPEGKGVRVLINLDCAENQKYRGDAAGPFLADIALHWVATDMGLREEHYHPLLKELIGEEIPETFNAMRTRIRGTEKDEVA